MPQVIYAPQYTNPFAQMLPQFLSQMILNTQTEKFREKMLNQERGFELEKAGFTTQAPAQEGVPEDADYTPPPARPDIEVAGKGYYAPKLEFQTIPNMPGHVVMKQGLSKQIIKAEDLTLDEKLFKKGLVKVPGLGLFKAAQDESGNLDFNKLTPVATIPKGPPVGSPEWMEAQKELARFKSGLKEPEQTSEQLKTKEWTDESGIKWEQDRIFNPKTRKLEDIGEPRKVGTDAIVTQRRNYANNIRAEFNRLPDVKEFQEVDSRMKVMDEAIAESLSSKNKVAADQALITTFNKMTDPNSVVRESEYARTTQDLSLVNRLKGKVAKISEGGPGLTQSDRDAIYRLAQNFHKTLQLKYKSRVNEYRGYISNAGEDPEKYLNPVGAGGETVVEPTGGHKLDQYWTKQPR